MKERPILFSGPMVRAILAGTKTQTRRIAPISDLNIKPHSDDLVTWGVSFTKPLKGVLGSHSGGRFSDLQARSIIASQFNPYGQPGDRLWVREAWAPGWTFMGERPCIFYRATGNGLAHREQRLNFDASVGATAPDGMRWKPSIHMPRWASRITLEVTGVRVERLQDISEADALEEGITYNDLPNNGLDPRRARTWYRGLWESINGTGSWDANPFVWVVEFKRVKGGAA